MSASYLHDGILLYLDHLADWDAYYSFAKDGSVDVASEREALRGVLDTCSEICADIEADSVDFIITDPPYPKEFLPLYGDLAKFGARVLKPGGLLIVMCGQSWLPQIMWDMSAEIDYLWTVTYLKFR